MIVSTASTLVLVRLLLERGERHVRHGRVAVGITLVDDLAVVVFIIGCRPWGRRERFGILVPAVTRDEGEVLVNPSADTLLRAGDRVRVFGLPEQVATFEAAGRDGGSGEEETSGRTDERNPSA
jgi:hypothetical protein